MMNVSEFNRILTAFAEENYFNNDSMEWKWSTGGMSGGNCWGGEANYFESGEGPPDETLLDLFLEAHFPEITFVHYKKILSNLEHFNYTDREYYGNFTRYEGRRISRAKLVELLIEFKYIEDS